ncbi:MAG: phosphoglucomutase (alpha-D-glucose-1,6-bisphosphate-dependent) [Halieaceae bacterium]|nr:phosphoglucomutase (alpha-D-glucose-1,6-bisphosphate-dependent) [Halieaceae bacterium]MCP5188586.1 alpha-D-glucose phosphate-specific phosphoglucomutase [Pseudomonadales bacterium]
MALDSLAGQLVPRERLADIPALVKAYHELAPDPEVSAQGISFGTSGHRGCALTRSFNRHHILAITQAVCEYRREAGINGPVFVGQDTHALSAPAQEDTIEVLAGNGVTTLIAADNGFTPTPLVSFAVLAHNRQNSEQADGIVISPSHNPPEDGGFKYNPPNGGPADVDITSRIQQRANDILRDGLRDVVKLDYQAALQSEFVRHFDYVSPYVEALAAIIDMEAIRSAGLKIGVDPLGGASIAVYQKINEVYGLGMDIVNPDVDPAFAFMTLDHDGKIRMDCSSPYAMASLVALKDRFDIAFANDVDSDRHGIVTPSGGLMNPNHYLSVAISYLFQQRRGWPDTTRVGKTLVSSAMIDRVTADLGRTVIEVPVGFKWFVDGLLSGELGFGGEESAGASFLRFDGSVWTTDKDGIILNLLAAEICAKTGRDPSQLYQQLEDRFGKSYYTRVDAPASNEQKLAIKSLDAKAVTLATLAGEPVDSVMTTAPGNNAAIGGVKVTARNSWFALRPSGTEAIYKIYAESFISEEHLQQVLREVKQFVTQTLG